MQKQWKKLSAKEKKNKNYKNKNKYKMMKKELTKKLKMVDQKEEDWMMMNKKSQVQLSNKYKNLLHLLLLLMKERKGLVMPSNEEL